MPKATLQRAFLILLNLALFFQFGCIDSENARAKKIQKAVNLHAAGDSDSALEILERLARKNPDNASILSQIGSIYKARGDNTVAAFFLEQAYQKTPDNIDLLYKTYIAQTAAGEPSEDLLKSLSQKAPEAMTAPLWIELGNHYVQTNQSKSALDAYLKGVNSAIETPTPSISVTIGKLFFRLNNKAQAESWFKIAAESDDPNALTALFGILEIKLNEKDWLAAESTISQLDKQFPGAVDASEWADARIELKRWRKAQTAMKSKLAEADAVKKTMIEAQVTEFAAEKTLSKAQAVAELEAAEILANTPALEDAVEQPEAPTVTFNPNIAIEPADPAIDFERSDEQQNTSATTSDIVIPSQPLVGYESLPLLPIRDLETILNEAEQANLDRNFEGAIRLYWQALGQANDNADIWNMLSRAYLVNSQIRNAETTALEAIRLQPRKVDYALDYLRIAQRSKEPDQFLAEVETAYDRFPRSPEITLSLARAYERIGNNGPSAHALYQRFIEIAPDHPLRSEADTALTRIP